MDRFAQGLAALARFGEREGHAQVPRAHKEVLEAVERADGSGEMEAGVTGRWASG